MDLGWRYIGSFPNKYISQRSIVSNVNVTSYKVANRIAYAWETDACTIWRFWIEGVNVKIMQHVFYLKILCAV